MTVGSGRDDYDSSFKIASLKPGEPFFVLRAQDAVAGDAVRGWASLAHAAGAPAEALELALQHADRMDAWPQKKKPDGPDLDEGQRKQLRNQLSRRAWRAQARLDGDEALLAFRLGQDQVLGQLRPIVAALADGIEAGRHADHATLAALFAVVGRDFAALKRVILEPAD